MHKLQLSGSLNIQTINDIRMRHETELEHWLKDGLEIDVSRVEQIDTAGLQYLLMVQQQLQQAGQGIVIRGGGLIDAAAQRLGLQEALFGG
jgi:ABC-type transporter Mla MlaB component